MKKPRKLRLSPTKVGLPLAQLLRVHQQFRGRGSLPLNLGDAFLCAEHPVYRALREEARRRGIRFRAFGREAYFAYPLMALDEAIERNEIPYRPNFLALEALERSAPGVFTLPDLRRGELQYNYLFHETAHLVAHAELFGAKPPRRQPKNARTLLGVMLGEAYANAVECLASAFAEGEIAGYFLDANCHFRANEKEARLLWAAGRRWGWHATFLVLLGAFLYSNYLFERLTSSELARLAKWAGMPPGAPIARLARIGLQLNERFRTTTTPLHLRKTGFSAAALPKLFRVDPLRLLLEPRHSALREGALRLAEIAVRALPENTSR